MQCHIHVYAVGIFLTIVHLFYQAFLQRILLRYGKSMLSELYTIFSKISAYM